MNTLVAVSIAPLGIGDELAKEVAQIVQVIRQSGLPCKTSAMYTEIEGEWDEVMAVIKQATMVLTNKGIRTMVSIKADIRPGHKGTMISKLEHLEAAMEQTDE